MHLAAKAAIKTCRLEPGLRSRAAHSEVGHYAKVVLTLSLAFSPLYRNTPLMFPSMLTVSRYRIRLILAFRFLIVLSGPIRYQPTIATAAACRRANHRRPLSSSYSVIANFRRFRGGKCAPHFWHRTSFLSPLPAAFSHLLWRKSNQWQSRYPRPKAIREILPARTVSPSSATFDSIWSRSSCLWVTNPLKPFFFKSSFNTSVARPKGRSSVHRVFEYVHRRI